MSANEVPIAVKMKRLNTARGRKGAWFRKNTTKWDRMDNIAREKEAISRAQFVHDFAFVDTITVDDYTFELSQEIDPVLGVLALGRLIN